MGKAVWKIIFGVDAQEKWLNEMAAKGLHLTSVSFPLYEFEEDDSLNYIYKVDPIPGISLKPRFRRVDQRLYDSASLKFIDNAADLGYLKQEPDFDEDGNKAYNKKHYGNCIKHYALFVLLWVLIGIILWLLTEDEAFQVIANFRILILTIIYIVLGLASVFCIWNIVKAFKKSRQ